MAETDAAGWYPDPAKKHELRYWDGYVWLDNVSDGGTASADPIGGTPFPAPSQISTGPAPAPSAPGKSKAPMFIAIGVVLVLVIGAAAFLLTRGDDKNAATPLVTGKKISIDEAGKDKAHPTIHTFHSAGNQVIVMKVTPGDDTLAAGLLVVASQPAVDSLNKSISGLSDILKDKLQDDCKNLREEDIGAKGNVAYFFDEGTTGKALSTFTITPIAGDYEFVPVLVDSKGNCSNGKLSMTLDVKAFDFGGISDSDGLVSKLSDDNDLSEFFSS
jgi:hypothetical protein